MSKWYSLGGADNDVILYSKVRLARNLSDTPFKNKLSPEIKRSTVKKLYACVKNSELAGEFELIDLANQSNAQAAAYAERRMKALPLCFARKIISASAPLQAGWRLKRLTERRIRLMMFF